MKQKIKLKKRTSCEIWSRVCGYLRPITSYNEGKLAEFHDRKHFNVQKILEGENGESN